MAYTELQLSKVANLKPAPNTQHDRQLWLYNGGADAVSDIAAAGYFNPARELVKVGDLIQVVGAANGDVAWLAVTAAPAQGNVTTSAISDDPGATKIARGQHTTIAAVDTVATGLANVVAVIATLDDDPVDGAQLVTASIGNQAGAPAAGSVRIKSWKATGDADATLIAATTFGKKVNWIAFGS